MVDSVFLKSTKRIEALMMVMTLCVLVYNFAQHKLRTSLVQKNNATIPNQLNKPIQNPTLRWVFQLMEGISIVRLAIDMTTNHYRQIITGLNKLRKHILYHLGESVCAMYGLIYKNINVGLGM